MILKAPLVVASVLLAIGAVLAASRTRAQPTSHAVPGDAEPALTLQGVSNAPSETAAEEPPPAPGERLERIHCADGYEAFVFAIDVRGADGLALDSKGRLLVVEEGRGELTRFDKSGARTTLATGLRSPEGVFAAASGELFVVEDTRDGRLLSVGPQGKLTTLASNLDAPEGVLLVGDRLFVTQSTAELETNKFKLHTRLVELHREGLGWSEPELVLERRLPFSFSELIADGDTRLILANELAGSLIRAGLVSVDLETGDLSIFATGLISPEGLGWSANGSWPLFVAEEASDGEGHGRLSTVDQHGKRTTFATGFGNIEDVVVTKDGRIFVSEDVDRQIVELRPH